MTFPTHSHDLSGIPRLVDTHDSILVHGARVHNLKNIDAAIPRDRLVVFTGVSGSGKSSLAFDTLFAEGQRRYLESLSTYTRQFLDQLERPDVDLIEGLPPTLSIEQRVGSAQLRSTLATTSEVYDYLRLLYARAGQAHCPQCGRPVSRQSRQAIVEQMLALGESRKVMILAPLVQGRKGTHGEVFAKIVKEGFVRARVDGEVVDVTAPPKLAKTKPHTIEAVIDRIVIKEGIRSRLEESVDLALRLGEGACLISDQEDGQWHDHFFSSRFACLACGLSFPELEPRTFSFNSPYGACPRCQGLGVLLDDSVSAAKAFNSTQRLCPDCGGARLGPLASAVTVAGLPIHELTALTVSDAVAFFDRLTERLQSAEEFSAAGRLAAQAVLPDLQSRLRFLQRVGLDYLTLNRPTRTLSGGEFQRARLAACLGSGLVGVCYVLDEPTIGLHPTDTARLLETLKDLRDQGNSLIVVEHDIDVIRRADYVIDLGPGAGRDGGEVIAVGTPSQLINDPNSVIGRFLNGDASPHRMHRTIDPARQLVLTGANLHNLQEVTLELPLGVLTCITGVSGSGKSSLIMQTLVPAVAQTLATGTVATGPFTTLTWTEPLHRVVEVDQSPIGRTGRSNPATYSGIWDEVRKVFAQTKDARVRGYSARRFSFNAKEGRCPECAGQGTKRIEMKFLPDLFVTCPRCRGARFTRQTLEIRYRGKSVADVLALRMDEAATFFESFPRLRALLATFVEVGLGYLLLGQPSSTLSGGEAQRVKLATELARSTGEKQTLFVLDEPTTGLHPADIARLVGVLQRLIDQGNTVVVIEHELEMVAAADWVIDLGPGGGATGGRIVAAGPPEVVASCPESRTGAVLAGRG